MLTVEDLAEATGYTVRVVRDLERGRLVRPAPELLDAVAKALRWGQDDREALYALATDMIPVPAGYVTGSDPRLSRLLQALHPHPSYATDAAWSVVGQNLAVAQWMVDFSALPEPDRNVVRWIFCYPHARHVFANWSALAEMLATRARTAVARYPDDRQLSDLVAEMQERSPDFAHLWETAPALDINPATEVRQLRRPGHTVPGRTDDDADLVRADVVVLEPWSHADQRRIVTLLLPDDEPILAADVRSAVLCPACQS